MNRELNPAIMGGILAAVVAMFVIWYFDALFWGAVTFFVVAFASEELSQ